MGELADRENMGGTVYRCSDGRYLGDAEVWERFESGEWTPCCWNGETGAEWVETADGELVVLRPVPQEELPDWVRVDRDEDGVRVSGRETATPG